MKLISEDDIVYDSAEPVETAGSNAAAVAAGGLPNVTDSDAADIALASDTTDESLSIGDVASQAFENLGPSAKQFATDMIQPLIHPVDTYENFKGLGRGVYQLFTPGTQPDEAKAEAVGKFFADRYGKPVEFLMLPPVRSKKQEEQLILWQFRGQSYGGLLIFLGKQKLQQAQENYCATLLSISRLTS